MRTNHESRTLFVVVALLALGLCFTPSAAPAGEGESAVAAEIKAVIAEGNAYTRDHMMDQEGGVSKDGSLEFWSSGGLLQWGSADTPPSAYVQFSISATHVKVFELPGGAAAVAVYYSEGSMSRKGSAPVGE
jgi:hypothetical protein